MAAYDELTIDVTHVYHVSGKKAVHFLPCWSYAATLWIATGTIDSFYGPRYFSLTQPLETMPLRDFLQQQGACHPRQEGGQPAGKRQRREPRQLDLVRETLVWNSVARADVVAHSKLCVQLTPRAPRPKAAPGEAEEEEDPFDKRVIEEFEKALGELIEMGEAGESEALVATGLDDQLEEPEDAVLEESGHADEPEEPDPPADPRPRYDAGHGLVEPVKIAVQACMERLRDARRYADVQSPATHPMRHGVISMIRREGAIMFIRWTTRPGKCRQIHLDSLDRVKTVGPVPELDLNGQAYDVLIRDTLAIMIQTTAGGRPHMTPWALTLRRYYEMQLFQGPFPPNAMDCVACMQEWPIQGFDDRREWEEQCQMFVCTSCLGPWHRFCLNAFVEPPYPLADFVCPVCARVGAFSD